MPKRHGNRLKGVAMPEVKLELIESLMELMAKHGITELQYGKICLKRGEQK